MDDDRPVEYVEDLRCPEGHSVQVHWTEGQQAEAWQCPKCLVAFHTEETAAAAAAATYSGPDELHRALQDAGARAHDRSLVAFRGGR